jgi:thioredoxin-dependent peroxiredoxin
MQGMISLRTLFRMSLLSAILLSPFTMTADPITLGAKLPAVSVPSQDGKTIELATEASKGFTLVYFYPKADTPGCTSQACSLRDAYAELTEKGVRVYGVSMDDVADQKKFQEKYQLPFTLLADSEGAVVKAFGVPYAGTFAKRQAFLFKDGVLVWHDAKASTKEQAQDVLAAIAAL